MTGVPADLPAIAERLVVANRVLVDHDIVDAFGHVSARHPGDASLFLMARRVPPEMVGADDIRIFGPDGELADDTGDPAFLERYIHSAIYAARPDVHGIVHSHAHNAVMFSIAPQPLRAVSHISGFLGTATPVFEMRDCAAPSHDLLIRTPALGAALAARLGDAAYILMRGHGSTAVGATIEQAVYRAVYADVGAEIQRGAMALGGATPLSAEEVATMAADDAINYERAWALWRHRYA